MFIICTHSLDSMDLKVFIFYTFCSFKSVFPFLLSKPIFNQWRNCIALLLALSYPICSICRTWMGDHRFNIRYWMPHNRCVCVCVAISSARCLISIDVEMSIRLNELIINQMKGISFLFIREKERERWKKHLFGFFASYNHWNDWKLPWQRWWSQKCMHAFVLFNVWFFHSNRSTLAIKKNFRFHSHNVVRYLCLDFILLKCNDEYKKKM